MGADRTFWSSCGVVLATVFLITVFLITDHIGRPFEILRSVLMIPGIMLSRALSSPIEANGKGWGILMVAAAINWFSHCICSCLWYPTVEEKKANRQPSE